MPSESVISSDSESTVVVTITEEKSQVQLHNQQELGHNWYELEQPISTQEHRYKQWVGGNQRSEQEQNKKLELITGKTVPEVGDLLINERKEQLSFSISRILERNVEENVKIDNKFGYQMTNSTFFNPVDHLMSPPSLYYYNMMTSRVAMPVKSVNGNEISAKYIDHGQPSFGDHEVTRMEAYPEQHIATNVFHTGRPPRFEQRIKPTESWMDQRHDRTIGMYILVYVSVFFMLG